MSGLTIYTLKSCDTCKKALKWLDAESIAYTNHDVRADGLDRSTIASIVENAGWETALNRRSTTWRGLGDADKEAIDNAKAIALIAEHPTLMKRPVFVAGNNVVVGFDAKAQAAVSSLGK